MNDSLTKTDPKPGIVIFVAMLNFISVAFFLFLSILSLSALVFGNVLGIYDWVTRTLAQAAPWPNFSYGLTFIFGVAMVVCLCFLFFFLWIGIGLLKGKKLAWYLQIAMSILGVVGFPVGTVLNVLILVFFFRPSVRNYFKV